MFDSSIDLILDHKVDTALDGPSLVEPIYLQIQNGSTENLHLGSTQDFPYMLGRLKLNHHTHKETIHQLG